MAWEDNKEQIIKSEKDKANRFAYNNPDVDLTSRVILNKNPYLIPAGTNTAGWVYFQKYLSKLYEDHPDKLTELNSKEGFLISQQIINDFNNNYVITVGDTYDVWKVYQNGNVERKSVTRQNVASFKFLDRFPNGRVDIETIKSAQKYHLLTSFSGANRVIVDGWVGSQTAQLKYPGRFLTYLEDSDKEDIKGKPAGILTKDGIVSSRPKYKTGLIPGVWGNQRFVLDARVVDKYVNDVETGVLARAIPEKIGDSGVGLIPFEYFIPYDPSLHDMNLQFKDQKKYPNSPTPPDWYTIGQTVEVYKDPATVNSIIKEQQLKDKKLKYTTDAKQDITLSPEDKAKQRSLKEQSRKDMLTRSNELAKLYTQ